jgi:hypothetical protein
MKAAPSHNSGSHRENLQRAGTGEKGFRKLDFSDPLDTSKTQEDLGAKLEAFYCLSEGVERYETYICEGKKVA